VQQLVLGLVTLDQLQFPVWLAVPVTKSYDNYNLSPSETQTKSCKLIRVNNMTNFHQHTMAGRSVWSQETRQHDQCLLDAPSRNSYRMDALTHTFEFGGVCEKDMSTHTCTPKPCVRRVDKVQGVSATSWMVLSRL
jgi:hypothetical protein